MDKIKRFFLTVRSNNSETPLITHSSSESLRNYDLDLVIDLI